MLADVTNPFIEWIFPRRCLVCNIGIKKASLCRLCLNQCQRNNNQTFTVTGNTAYLFYFELTVKHIIKEAKYNNSMHAASVLFDLVRHEIEHSPLMHEIADFNPTAVSFVPRHIFSRLYRTIELPYLFAAMLAKKIDRPIVTLVRKNEVFSRQVLRSKKHQRLQEIKGQFSLLSDEKEYQRLLIVDDVITTGATLKEVSKIVSAICSEIKCITVAKTA